VNGNQQAVAFNAKGPAGSLTIEPQKESAGQHVSPHCDAGQLLECCHCNGVAFSEKLWLSVQCCGFQHNAVAFIAKAPGRSLAVEPEVAFNAKLWLSMQKGLLGALP